MNLEELRLLLRASGIAGAGGAGFPAYAKLNKRTEILILNCAECEPLLRVHRQLLAAHALEIMKMLSLIGEAVGAKEIIVGVKPAYQRAVEALEKNLSLFPKMRLHFLPEIYPAGDEVVLIYEATRRVVPQGEIPISVGVTVFNVETVYQAYQAYHGQPVTSKYLTITGEVRTPVTSLLPLGTTVEEAVAAAGGLLCEDVAYIMGGPMTGKLVKPYDVITKTANAILVLPKLHPVVMKKLGRTDINLRRAMSCCCNCRMCTDLCPRNLLGHSIAPHWFMRAVSSGVSGDTDSYLSTLFCVSCGLCEMYSCTQGLAPASLIAVCKNELKKNGLKPSSTLSETSVHPYRNERYVSIKRLIERLSLNEYDVDAPLREELLQVRSVKLMLSQHIGAPAHPTVKQGDYVEIGSMVAEPPQDGLGLPVHASISGRVVEVKESFIILEKE